MRLNKPPATLAFAALVFVILLAPMASLAQSATPVVDPPVPTPTVETTPAPETPTSTAEATSEPTLAPLDSGTPTAAARMQPSNALAVESPAWIQVNGKRDYINLENEETFHVYVQPGSEWNYFRTSDYTGNKQSVHWRTDVGEQSLRLSNATFSFQSRLPNNISVVSNCLVVHFGDTPNVRINGETGTVILTPEQPVANIAVDSGAVWTWYNTADCSESAYA